MTHFTIRPLCLSIATLLAMPLAAQNPRTFTAVRTQNYGVALAGGSTTLRATATVTTPATPFGPVTLAAGLSNIASVRLFGVNHEAAAMIANMNATHAFVGLSPTGAIFMNTSTGSYSVRLGGFTVLSAASFSLNISSNLSADVFPSNGVAYDVSLLGFGVHVTGNVTGRANYDLTPTIVFNNGFAVDLNGPVRSSAVGHAGASVSALGASVGVSTTLTYANTNGTAALHVTPAGATGSIPYTVQQIRLVLRVFASLALPFLPVLTSDVTVFDHSTAAQAGTLNLLEN